MAKLEAEQDNIRAALRWSIDMGRIDMAAQVAGGLSTYWYMSSNINEGRAWLEELAEHEGLAALAPQVQAYIGCRAGFLALAQYRGAVAIRRFEQSLPIARRAGDETLATTILGYMGLVEMFQGNYARAESLSREALAAFREQHRPLDIGRSLHNLALISLYKGEYERAVSLAEEAIPLFRAVGNKWGTSNVLGLMGIALAKNGKVERAHGVADEAAATIEGLSGNNDVVGLAITCKAEVAKARGDYGLAEALYRDSLRKVGKTGSYFVIAMNLIGLGLMAVSRGEAARAVTFFGALDGLSERLQVAFVTPSDRPQYERSLTNARTSLGEQEWSQAWARGLAMSPDEALDFALEEMAGI
jgi:tetratricopeptide (TPR) repeat protein